MQAKPDTSRSDFPFTELLDLVNERMGGSALFTNDEFFAPKENLVRYEPAVFIPGKYTDVGKWMDGWESRRKRNLGPGNDHDWCVLKLGAPGTVHGVDVDTAHFTGNFPESCAIDACFLDGELTEGAIEKQRWTEIVPMTRLQGGTRNLIAVSDRGRYTHVRLRIYPDGGVARLRVHGEAKPDLAKAPRVGGLIDLGAAANGAVVVTANDMYFGPKDNLILPGRAKNMGEGWETRRRRGPGHDWIVIKLAATAKLKTIDVDTHHFKGNFPESCLLEGLAHPSRDLDAKAVRDRSDLPWRELVPRSKLQADHAHVFELKSAESYDYVRLSIFPDGGISRLKALGDDRVKLMELNSLPDHLAREEFLKVCGSREWARAMEDARPFDKIKEAHATAQECWNNLSHGNRLEAFAAHPRIGERSGSAWSKQEQGGVSGEDALKQLLEGNKAYEARFKHVFLICATGKSASEILSALQARMSNTPEKEFEVACAEQAKIISLRMEKLIQP